jgi:tetratricopeptide (TPR) repeat protein
MKAFICAPLLRRIAVVLLCAVLCHAGWAAPDDPASGAGSNVTAAAQSSLETEWIRSFLHLQEQVHETQLSIERSRIEADRLAARNAEALDARLRLLEKTLDETQKLNADSMRDTMGVLSQSNERMMTLAGAFAVAGFLALLGTAWLQWRTVTRMTTLPSTASLPPWWPVPGQTTPPAVASARLMDAMGRLEQRISGLEHRPESAAATVHTGPDAASRPSESNGRPQDAPPADAAAEAVSRLLQEGEACLAREELEAAVERFDAVLSQDPAHTEALLRKGIALERLQRMERFTEAMNCYEQALKTQEARPAVT